MTVFSYTVKDRTGKTHKGVMDVAARQDLIGELRKKDFIIVSIKEEKGKAAAKQSGKKTKITLDDIVIFSRQLATMVDSGIPLVTSLDILAEQIENKSFAEVISKIGKDVETGSSLSDSLAKHPRVFSSLFVNMVKAGESSGMLDDILDRLALYLEKTSGLQKKIKSAMIYPAVVTTMAVGITLLMLLKVIPVFKDIYSGFGAALPGPTMVLITLSDFVRKYFFFAVIFSVIVGIMLNRYVKTDVGSYRKDAVSLKMPVFGPLLRKVAVSKFTRTLSTLIKSGVPILSSLEIVAKTAGNKVVEKAVSNVQSSIKEGENIAEPLSKSGVFPPMVVRMIAVGEQTGELEKMLTKISDFYDEQVDAAVNGLTSLIEPLIIAFLGIVIGTIVICMFLPIFQISSIVGF
jgi:type IV pilus assembly protein PilC